MATNNQYQVFFFLLFLYILIYKKKIYLFKIKLKKQRKIYNYNLQAMFHTLEFVNDGWINSFSTNFIFCHTHKLKENYKSEWNNLCSTVKLKKRRKVIFKLHYLCNVKKKLIKYDCLKTSVRLIGDFLCKRQICFGQVTVFRFFFTSASEQLL